MKVNAILKRNASQNAREKQSVFRLGDFEYKHSTRELVHPTRGTRQTLAHGRRIATHAGWWRRTR